MYEVGKHLIKQGSLYISNMNKALSLERVRGFENKPFPTVLCRL